MIARYSRPDRVWVERRDREIVEERSNPRAALAGHDREYPWDRLHMTYLIGYAMWNYLTVPSLFAKPGFVTQELAEHNERGETWRVLEVHIRTTFRHTRKCRNST
jgi:hypothetical protein